MGSAIFFREVLLGIGWDMIAIVVGHDLGVADRVEEV